jgi:hypothetical protein
MRGRPRTLGSTDMEPQEIGIVYRVPDVDFGGCFSDVKLAAGDPGQAAIGAGGDDVQALAGADGVKSPPLRLAYRRPDLVDRLLAENPTIAGGLDGKI